VPSMSAAGQRVVTSLRCSTSSDSNGSSRRPPTDDLAEFVQQAIGPLVRHDRANHTDLVETLGVWLETRNMAEAARRIHVHYNTLKNRLERVEALIGPVLTDAARALECEVAIYVDRHYDVAWADHSDSGLSQPATPIERAHLIVELF